MMSDTNAAANMADSSAAAGNDGMDLPTYIPPADIFETPDALLLFLDVPGADPNSLDVTLNNRELTVSASGKPPDVQGYKLVHAEFRPGNYQRRFIISEEVDGDHVDATFKNGTLNLRLPKSRQPVKKIPVKAN
jgi:HSP20 family protein